MQRELLNIQAYVRYMIHSFSYTILLEHVRMRHDRKAEQN